MSTVSERCMAWLLPLLPYVGSAVLALLAAGFTAYWTYYFGTRQHYWKSVVDDKRRRMDEYLDASRAYIQIVQLSSNLHTAARLDSTDDRVASLVMQIQRLLVDADSAQEKALYYMVQHVVPDYFPHSAKAEETEARCRALLTGIHNQLVTRLGDALHELQNKYARLSMVCYDPSRPAALKRFAVALTQRIVDYPPPSTKIDFRTEFKEWVRLSGQVTVYLRLDLEKSLHGFRKATRLKPEWQERHKDAENGDR